MSQSPAVRAVCHGLAAVLTMASVGLAQQGVAPLSRPDAWTIVGGRQEWGDATLRLTALEHQAWAFHRGAAMGDTSVSVRFRMGDAGSGVKAAGLILRSQDSRSGIFVHYDSLNNQIILTRDAWGDNRREIARRRGVVIDTNRWYEARTDVVNDQIRVYLDGEELLTGSDGAVHAGYAGVYVSQGDVEFEGFAVAGTPAEPPIDWRIRMHYDVPTDQASATIDRIFSISKQPGRYIGWPTVCRRRDGELLAVFSGDRDQHVCPWGKVQLVRSSDNGLTWSAPVSICNTPLDDRDAGIIETRQGTLVVAWFTSLAFESSLKGAWLKSLEGDAILNQWRLHAEKLTPEIRAQWLGYWTRRSEDGGKTWDAPVQTQGSAPHGPIELADGRLLYIGRRYPHANTVLTVEESRDDGRSWQQIASILADPGDNISEFHEPHVVEAADGSLVALFRYHWTDPQTKKRDGRHDYMRQSVSTDGGRTWTVAQATPLLGYPPHLIRLRNNAILCVYGRRLAPFGEYACISWDNGRTWDVAREIKLAGALNSDLGYPASTEMADGSILTIYYQIHESGEKTSLMGTHWRLKDR